MNPLISDAATKLYLAPLQGYTDYIYRNAFASLFGAPDAVFSPFIETHVSDHRMFRDVLPEKITGYRLVPQLLGKEAKEMETVVNQLIAMGYTEVNWNLGCPYSMVTKKGRGAGLLPHPDLIDRVLDEIFKSTACRISIKMRLGLTSHDDWKALLPVLNRYPLSEVIVHGRTASQMYKGEPDVVAFMDMAAQLTHPVCYNGNIFTLEQYQSLSTQMPFIHRWMLGRGVLANPLLMQEIRSGVKTSEHEIRTALGKLHEKLIDLNGLRLSGSSHVLNKMKPYWEYFAASFSGREKGLKKIKKSVTLDAYQMACNELFRD
jgi:tRNA-dihydrouridine synthase